MPYKLSVDLPTVNAGYDYTVLTGKSNTFSYSDGKRVSDETIGVKLTVALQSARFVPLTTRYLHDPLLKVNDEDIEAVRVGNNLIYVQIPDCVINLYSSNSGGIGMIAAAQTAQIVTLDSKQKYRTGIGFPTSTRKGILHGVSKKSNTSRW